MRCIRSLSKLICRLPSLSSYICSLRDFSSSFFQKIALDQNMFLVWCVNLGLLLIHCWSLCVFLSSVETETFCFLYLKWMRNPLEPWAADHSLKYDIFYRIYILWIQENKKRIQYNIRNERNLNWIGIAIGKCKDILWVICTFLDLPGSRLPDLNGSVPGFAKGEPWETPWFLIEMIQMIWCHIYNIQLLAESILPMSHESAEIMCEETIKHTLSYIKETRRFNNEKEHGQDKERKHKRESEKE